MIRSAAGSDLLNARHYLCAAIEVAKDKGPAMLACMRFYEQCADTNERLPQKVYDYIEALRHAERHKDRRRLADKMLQAVRSAEFAEYEHACTAPAQEIQGQTGLERVKRLAGILHANMLPARMLLQDGGGIRGEISVGNDGMAVLSRGDKYGGGAGHGEVAARWARFLTAYISAIARDSENDGRITAGDHADRIMSSGLRRGPSGGALITAGIERHYEGDYASSIHILLPQVESTLRGLLRQKGVDVESEQPGQSGLLHPLIKGGAEIVGDDMSAFLHAWLTDAASVNLRNRVCHGLYGGDDGDGAPPHDLNHGTSLALILAIGLLSGMCQEGSGAPPDRGGR